MVTVNNRNAYSSAWSQLSQHRVTMVTVYLVCMITMINVYKIPVVTMVTVDTPTYIARLVTEKYSIQYQVPGIHFCSVRPKRWGT